MRANTFNIINKSTLKQPKFYRCKTLYFQRSKWSFVERISKSSCTMLYYKDYIHHYFFFFNVSVPALKMKARLICDRNQIFTFLSNISRRKHRSKHSLSFASAISYASWDRVTLWPRWKGCARWSNEGSSRRFKTNVACKSAFRIDDVVIESPCTLSQRVSA